MARETSHSREPVRFLAFLVRGAVLACRQIILLTIRQALIDFFQWPFQTPDNKSGLPKTALPLLACIEKTLRKKFDEARVRK